MEREVDRLIGQRLVLMRLLHRSVVMKEGLSWNVTLSVYRSICTPVISYGHEIWVVTEGTSERGFHRRAWVRSSAIQSRAAAPH